MVGGDPIRSEGSRRGGRALGLIEYLGACLAFIAILFLANRLFAHGLATGDGDSFAVDGEVMWRANAIPEIFGLAFVVGLIAWLGWWQPVAHGRAGCRTGCGRSPP